MSLLVGHGGNGAVSPCTVADESDSALFATTFAVTSSLTTTGDFAFFDFFTGLLLSADDSELDDESESLSLSGSGALTASANSLATCFAESDSSSESESELEESLLLEELSELELSCLVFLLFFVRDELLSLLDELELEPELESESELELELEDELEEELLDGLLAFLLRDIGTLFSAFAGFLDLTSDSLSLEELESDEVSLEELLALSEDASFISTSEPFLSFCDFSASLSLSLPLSELASDPDALVEDAWLLYT